MKEGKVYKRSLELIDQFLEETSAEELSELIGQYDSLNIEGPTFDQYLSEFHDQFADISADTSISDDGSSTCIEIVDMEEFLYDIEVEMNNYFPPPPKHNNKSYKKDSATTAESFFLV